MIGLLPSRALLTMFLAVPLLGCAAKPPEKPIVLRPTRPERRLAHHPQMPIPPRADPAPSNAPLSPDQKENLFRGFETYLSRPTSPAGGQP